MANNKNVEPPVIEHDPMVPPLEYLRPLRIWVNDGHVLIESHSGKMLIMTPEVAVELSNKLGKAGADALINKVMSSHDRDGEV